MWPPCYCNDRALVQEINIINTYYIIAKGVEQNQKVWQVFCECRIFVLIRQSYISYIGSIRYIFDRLVSPYEWHS